MRAHLGCSQLQYQDQISASPMPLLCRLVETDSYEPTIATRSKSHAILVWSINYSPKKNLPSLVCLQRRIPSLSCVFVKASRRLWYPVPVRILIEDNSSYFLVQDHSSSRSFSLPSSNKHACKTDSPPSIMPDPLPMQKKGKIIFTKHR
jgi:hypothetical protein